jgi:hypothetical protein
MWKSTLEYLDMCYHAEVSKRHMLRRARGASEGERGEGGMAQCERGNYKKAAHLIAAGPYKIQRQPVWNWVDCSYEVCKAKSSISMHNFT